MFSFVVQSKKGLPGLLPFGPSMGLHAPLWTLVDRPPGSCWASPRALVGPPLVLLS